MIVATTGYDWLVFLHVLAAGLWIGGLTVMTALAVRVLRSREPDVAGFLGTLRAVGPWLFAPLPVIVLAMGIWMTADSGAWSADQGWIRIGIGLFAAIFAIGIGHQARTAILAQRAAQEGDDATARRLLRRWTYGMAAIVALQLAAYWDMTAKPGL